MWGYVEDDRLVSLCHVGANLVPVSATPDGAARRSPNARSARGPRSSTIVGPQDAVAMLWDGLGEHWPAAARRALGPAAPGDRRRAADRARPRWSGVRTKDDVDVLYPACVAMYTEEVGVSPGGRRRHATSTAPGSTSWSAAAGRSPASRTAGCVFKAEVACATP